MMIDVGGSSGHASDFRSGRPGFESLRDFLFFLFSVERTDLKISNEPKSLFATADSKTSIMTVIHSYNLANKSVGAS